MGLLDISLDLWQDPSDCLCLHLTTTVLLDCLAWVSLAVSTKQNLNIQHKELWFWKIMAVCERPCVDYGPCARCIKSFCMCVDSKRSLRS